MTDQGTPLVLPRANRTSRRSERPARRRPRLLVAGEFSAGKTKLINGLLGEKVLPSNVISTAVPPVWLIPGGGPRLAVDLEGETREIDHPADTVVTETKFCLVPHSASILSTVEIIDTPGSSDPNIPSECWERMVNYADAVIWCTNAAQAWRQSEKAVWEEMPACLRAKATLVITHADRMPDQRTADRVLRRVRREAGEYFATIVMGSSLDPAHLGRLREGISDLFVPRETLPGADEPVVDAAARTAALAAAVAVAPEDEAGDPDKVRPRRHGRRGEGTIERVRTTPRTGPDAEAEAEADATPETAAPDPAIPEAQDEPRPDASGTPPSGEAPSDASEPTEAAPEAPVPADASGSRAATREAGADTDAPPEGEAAAPGDAPDAAPSDPQMRPRAIWDVVARDADLSNAAEVLSCVERLLDALEGRADEPLPAADVLTLPLRAAQAAPDGQGAPADDDDELGALVRAAVNRR